MTSTCRTLLCSILVATLIAVASPAAAQTPAPSGSIQLVDQTDWVSAGTPFSLRVRVNTTLNPDQADMVVTIYNPLPNRSSFLQSLNDKITGASLVLERRSLRDVLNADGTVHIDLPVQDASQRRYFLRDPGVYPVRVDLREAGTGQVVDRFVTHLINEPATTVNSPLNVTTILPVQSPYPTGNDASSIPDNGQSVEVMASALQTHPALPIALLPQPETVERLEQRRTDGASSPALDHLIQARAGRTVVSGSWTSPAAGLFSDDLAGELNEQIDRGRNVIDRHFPNSDHRDWIANDQIDTAAAAKLKARGVQRVVVRENDLVAQARDTTLARPFGLSLGKNRGTLPAGQADRALTDHFADPRGPVLGSHRLLADLAVIWSDRPGQNRAVIVEPPHGWMPDATFLETYLRGLERAPILTAASLDQFFATPTEGSGRNALVRQLSTIPKAQATSFPANRITESRKRLTGFSSLVAADNKAFMDLSRRLLYAERADIDPRSRTVALDDFRTALDHQLNGVQMPAERSIRLTARQGEIPVSVQNDTGSPIRVTIRLSSDKLAFPGGNTRTITVERPHVTERFAVDARTSGAFPVQVRIESPDGSLLLRHSRITVRSTATSAVGLILSIGAGAFLMGWWARSAVKRRRTAKTA